MLGSWHILVFDHKKGGRLMKVLEMQKIDCQRPIEYQVQC